MRIGAPERMIAAAAVLLLAGAVVGGIRQLEDDPDPPPASAQGTEVEIRDFQFGPNELQVEPGATVIWTNGDGFEHNVRGVEDIPARSEDLAEGDVYEFTFTDAGTFEYVCTIHATMRGTVVVGEVEA